MCTHLRIFIFGTPQTLLNEIPFNMFTIYKNYDNIKTIIEFIFTGEVEMKNHIKGIITGIIIGAAVCSVHAMAADIVGEAVYTDIKLNLNGAVNPCYNVDDYVVITAEDLGHYGFDVNWNDADRKLYISRNPEYTKMSETEYADKTGEVGAHYADIYSSDIEVEFNGERVNSYSVNGEMLIKPEEALVADGITFNYNDDERMLYMRVDGLEEAMVYPLAESLVGYKTTDTIWIEDNGSVIIREHAYDYSDYKIKYPYYKYEEYDDVYVKYIEDNDNGYICIINGQHSGADFYSTHLYSRFLPNNMKSFEDVVMDIKDGVIELSHYQATSVFANGDDHNILYFEHTFLYPDGTEKREPTESVKEFISDIPDKEE